MCACRVSRSTVEMTRSAATFRAIRHRPRCRPNPRPVPRPGRPPAPTTPSPRPAARRARPSGRCPSSRCASPTRRRPAAPGRRGRPRRSPACPDRGSHGREQCSAITAAAPGTSRPPGGSPRSAGSRCPGGDRVVEHRGVQRAAALPGQHPGLGDHLPDRLEDPPRPRGGGQPAPPVGQHRRMEPAAVTASPHAAFHRRSNVTASTASLSDNPCKLCNTITDDHVRRHRLGRPRRRGTGQRTTHPGTTRRRARPGTRTPARRQQCPATDSTSRTRAADPPVPAPLDHPSPPDRQPGPTHECPSASLGPGAPASTTSPGCRVTRHNVHQHVGDPAARPDVLPRRSGRSSRRAGSSGRTVEIVQVHGPAVLGVAALGLGPPALGGLRVPVGDVIADGMSIEYVECVVRRQVPGGTSDYCGDLALGVDAVVARLSPIGWPGPTTECGDLWKACGASSDRGAGVGRSPARRGARTAPAGPPAPRAPGQRDRPGGEARLEGWSSGR